MTTRKFDHDTARTLRAEGMSIYKIAAQLNVSPTAVGQVVSPKIAASSHKAAKRYADRNRKTPTICPNCGRERCRLEACGNYRKTGKAENGAFRKSWESGKPWT